MEKDDQLLRTQTRFTLIVASIFAVALVTFYAYWFGIRNDVPLSAIDAAPWGAFGDFVGGLLNPFVAGCALFWLTRSVQIQRQELRETKKELAESRAAQENQAQTLEKQRFEDTFFSLLTQHNAVLTQLTATHATTGRRSVADIINAGIRSQSATLGEAKILLEERDDVFGHYFRILYQLLKLVATRCPNSSLKGKFSGDAAGASLPHPDEKLYTNIVRAFLNVEVTQLLAINCYCEDDSSTYWNYKCLIERYSFLEHMPFELKRAKYRALIEAYEFYDKLAFDKSEFIQTLN